MNGLLSPMEPRRRVHRTRSILFMFDHGCAGVCTRTDFRAGVHLGLTSGVNKRPGCPLHSALAGWRDWVGNRIELPSLSTRKIKTTHHRATCNQVFALYYPLVSFAAVISSQNVLWTLQNGEKKQNKTKICSAVE